MVTVSEFGKLSDGTSVSKYTIKNAAGMELQVLSVRSFRAPLSPTRTGR